MTNQLPPLCACGCGDPVKWNKRKKCWNKFIYGHNRRGKISGMKEKHHSDETRKKQSIANSGINHYSYNKGFSKKHRENLRKSHIKHGLTFTIGKQFLESKNYTCERCGFQELPKNKIGKISKIHAHHIISKEDAPDRINEFLNLCCLCDSCHKKYHYRNEGKINENSLKKFLFF